MPNVIFNNICLFIYRACEKGNCDIVKFLIEKGTIGSDNPFTGISPIYAACVASHVDIAEVLLKRFPESAKRGTKVENNMPLHIVSGIGNSEIMKLLLQVNDG